jgi:hypothetical protein
VDNYEGRLPFAPTSRQKKRRPWAYSTLPFKANGCDYEQPDAVNASYLIATDFILQ